MFSVRLFLSNFPPGFFIWVDFIGCICGWDCWNCYSGLRSPFGGFRCPGWPSYSPRLDGSLVRPSHFYLRATVGSKSTGALTRRRTTRCARLTTCCFRLGNLFSGSFRRFLGLFVYSESTVFEICFQVGSFAKVSQLSETLLRIFPKWPFLNGKSPGFIAFFGFLSFFSGFDIQIYFLPKAFWANADRRYWLSLRSESS